MALQGNATFDTALAAPVVRTIAASLGKPTLTKIICAVIKLFNDSLNVSIAMSPMQVFEAAHLWIDEYPTETVKDLILCLKRAKQGKYGQIYNRVDIAVLNEFFRKYLDEKAQYREEVYQRNKHNQSNPQEVIESFGSLVDELKIGEQVDRIFSRKVLPDDPNTRPMNESAYLASLKERLPFASEEELYTLRREAKANRLSDVFELADRELARRDEQTKTNELKQQW